MRARPFTDFTTANRQLLEADKNETGRLKQQKATQAEDWSKVVTENKAFVDRMLQGVRNYFSAATPLRSLLVLADIIALCETVFRLVNAPQGGEVLQQFLAFIVGKVAPPEIVSWVAWIGICFTSLYDTVLNQKKPGVVSGCLPRVAPYFGRAIEVMYGFAAAAADQAAKKKGRACEFEYVLPSSKME
jgi:hypothetical protein